MAGHVAVRGGVGLAVVGEPAGHGGQGLPGGLAGLVVQVSARL